MIKEYKYLLLVLVLALIGVISMQIYFTYNEYRLQTVDYNRQIDTLFQEAVKIEKKERLDCVIDLFKEGLRDTSSLFIETRKDIEENAWLFTFIEVATNDRQLTVSIPDKGQFSGLVNVYENDQVFNRVLEPVTRHLAGKAVFYLTELLGEELLFLTDSVIVDTIRLREITQELLTEIGFNSDFDIHIIKKEGEILDDPLSKSKGIKSAKYSTDIHNEEYFAQINLPNPFQDIIKKAWLSVTGSFLIIIITIACFVILLNSLAKQKALIQIKDDFIDNITHELQTPIATLMAANESMERYDVLDDKAKTQRYLKVSKDAIYKLSNMVDQALKNSIYQQQGLTVTPKWFDYRPIVKELLEQYSLKTEGKVSFNFEDTLPEQQLFSDPEHFTQVLDNLLANAIKHNPWDDLIIEIHAAKASSGEIQFQLKDTGQGIKLTDQKKIFDKYYRVDDRAGQGYGIGLYYVKKAMESLGGNVIIKSKVGEGSTFILTFPKNLS